MPVQAVSLFVVGAGTQATMVPPGHMFQWIEIFSRSCPKATGTSRAPDRTATYRAQVRWMTSTSDGSSGTPAVRAGSGAAAVPSADRSFMQEQNGPRRAKVRRVRMVQGWFHQGYEGATPPGPDQEIFNTPSASLLIVGAHCMVQRSSFHRPEHLLQGRKELRVLALQLLRPLEEILAHHR